MQVINLFFKGKQARIYGHMKTRHKIFFKNKFFNKKIINVNSYHNFGIPIKKISNNLEVIAVDKNDNVEMFKHKKKVFTDLCGTLREIKIIKNLT